MAEKKKRGLGRGLDSLIPPAAPAAPEKKTASKAVQAAPASVELKGVGTVKLVRLSKIEPDPSQPRKKFDQKSIEELAASIKEHGLIEPLIVQDMGTRYMIVGGERRWRACRIAGVREVPVIVKNYDDTSRVIVSLIDNLQREDLNAIEEAEAYQRLIDEFRLRQEDVAKKVSRSRTAITNSIRLLKLSDAVKEMVSDGRLPMGHARALLALEDASLQKALADRILAEDLSVRQTEKLVRDMTKPAAKKAAPAEDKTLDAIYREIEEKMNAALGMKVSIRAKGKKQGKLEIEFAGTDDLEKLMDRLLQ